MGTHSSGRLASSVCCCMSASVLTGTTGLLGGRHSCRGCSALTAGVGGDVGTHFLSRRGKVCYDKRRARLDAPLC